MDRLKIYDGDLFVVCSHCGNVVLESDDYMVRYQIKTSHDGVRYVSEVTLCDSCEDNLALGPNYICQMCERDFMGLADGVLVGEGNLTSFVCKSCHEKFPRCCWVEPPQ